MIGYILTCSIFILIVLINVSKRLRNNYWEKRPVPWLQPTLLLGNYSKYMVLKEYIGHSAQRICKKFPDSPCIGTYYGTEPALLVQDPEVLKVVLAKDFYYFSSREISNYTHNEVFTQNLFFTYGDRWKVIRQNLTPLFSSAKMKNMFYLIDNCARMYEKMLDNEIEERKIFDARSLVSRYTIDCIVSCAFGVDTKTMEAGDNNPFSTMGDLIFEQSTGRGLKYVARAIWPAIFYGLGFKLYPSEIQDFFSKLLIGVFEARQYQPSMRNDFIDLMLNLKKNKYIIGDSLTNMKTGEGKKIQLEMNDDLMVAQCIVFFAAGFETSATTLSFTLYELAKDQDAQKRAQDEVDAYLRKTGNKLGYSCVTELPYVDACVNETLRLYPVLGVVTREVVEDYTFPSGLQVDKGVRIHIPVYHLHKNPKFFPNPELFRPERFLHEEKQNIKPYTYIPFGEGPRICIGMRFARMKMYAGLITVLKKYNVMLADDMPRTVNFDPRSLVTQSIDGIRLKFIERSGWERRVFA